MHLIHPFSGNNILSCIPEALHLYLSSAFSHHPNFKPLNKRVIWLNRPFNFPLFLLFKKNLLCEINTDKDLFNGLNLFLYLEKNKLLTPLNEMCLTLVNVQLVISISEDGTPSFRTVNLSLVQLYLNLNNLSRKREEQTDINNS